MRLKRMPLAFDIETMPIADIRSVIDPFDPSSVKLGNIKDEKLKADKLNSERVKYYDNKLDRAALSPITGRVLAIGYMFNSKTDSFEMIFAKEESDEPKLLKTFWDLVEAEILKPSKHFDLTGWNIFGFDLPFLIKRSWKYKIKVPELLFQSWEARPYWSTKIRDGMKDFSLGVWEDKYCSLNVASKFIGLQGKSGEVTGKNWFTYALGSESQKALAREYLLNDCWLASEMYNATNVDVRGMS